MTKTYCPFDAGAGSSVYESQWSAMARLWRATGVVPSDEAAALNALEVYADSSGMLVKVKSGECWIHGHYLQSDAVESIALAAAHATYNRYDLIVAEVDWVNNTMDLVAVTGTPAGSPTVPSPTQTTSKWQIPLAYVLVDAAATSIAAAKVTDQRYYTTMKRTVMFQWLSPSADLATGDSKAVFVCPKEFHGWTISRVQGHVNTVSSSGLPDFMIHRVRSGASQDILSTALTIDANEKDSQTAATAAVINTSYNVMAEGDEFHLDVDGAGTGTKGPTVHMLILPPN